MADPFVAFNDFKANRAAQFAVVHVQTGDPLDVEAAAQFLP
jgi:hypothetical protein